jgi:hypothetical protein
LTTLKAVADETRSEERPMAAAVTCTSPPTATPSAETTPANLPRSML